jgi:hypothetical protein
MKKSRRLYRTSGLLADVTRCVGSRCHQKNTCERHLQIDRDAQSDKLNTAWWAPYTDVSPQDTEQCELKIEVEK